MRLLPFLFIACACVLGCRTPGPTLRALNVDEAKIVVHEDGSLYVYGQRTELAKLGQIVKDSDTEQTDDILIHLQGDPETATMKRVRRIIGREMAAGMHYKFRFVCDPVASVRFKDKRGVVREAVSTEAVRKVSGAEMHAEAEQMLAEANAYDSGTYQSKAALDEEDAKVIKPDAEPKKPAAKNAVSPTRSIRRNGGRR